MSRAQLRDVYAWIIDTLRNDPQLIALGHDQVWSHQAPKTATTPFFLLQKQTGGFYHTLGNKTPIRRHFVAIKSVTMGSEGASDGGDLGRQAISRAEELIGDKLPVLPNGYTMKIRFSSDFEYREAESGNLVFYHVGVVFEIILGSNL